MRGVINAFALLIVLGVLVLGCGQDRATAPSSGAGDDSPEPPQVTVTSPNGGETVAWSATIGWTALDPDPGETGLLAVALSYSADAGESWETIATDQTNDGSYMWDTSGLTDGTHHLVRATVTDTSGLSDSDVSDALFIVLNRHILVDRTGKEWDITYAVENYGMQPGNFWYGLGPSAIRPIINPRMLSPGDANYPADDLDVEVIGIEVNGDVRAYATATLCSHEVVDDVVGGMHVAVTY